MKIGILTFHCACNYGAVLQCYALQKVLSAAGHDVSVVDYRPKSISRGYKWFDIRRFWGATPARFWRKTSSELRIIKSRRKRYKTFEDFIATRLNLSCRVHGVSDMKALSQEYDMFVVGSDQVWNTKVTGGIDPIYWGDFPRDAGADLISYAASMEDDNSSDSIAAIKEFLPHFKAISVREGSLALRISQLLPGLSVKTVADPTMLLDDDEWNSIASPRRIHEPYLLFYQVRRSDEALRSAREYAYEKGLKFVCLSAKPELVNSEDVICSSPEDFVSLFRYASYVVTTSFHGTVFSIIYNRPFVCVEVTDGKSSRQRDLLKSLGLESREVITIGESADDAIDWHCVMHELDGIKSSSLSYLKDCGV